MSAEIRLTGGGGGFHAHASMGPRSDERGNAADSGYLVANSRLASMGPRSDERGNVAMVRARRLRRLASMGPRSDERGN